jgi:CBS domain-containing protein
MKTQRPNQQHAARGKEPERKKLHVRDVMSTNLNLVEPSDSVQDAAKKLRQFDVGSLPVCEGRRLVGIITDRDIVLRVLAEDRSVTTAVADAMSSDVIFAHEDDDITTLVKHMQDNEVRRVPVVNRHDESVGIVALADLARSNASDSLKVKGLQSVST